MILLASASPQRKALLKQIGINPLVLASDIIETLDPGDIHGSLKTLATQKLSASLEILQTEQRPPNDGVVWAIGADTIVLHDGKIIGKCTDEQEARDVLKHLAGRTHSVLTGLCLRKLKKDADGYSDLCPPVLEAAETRVEFRDLTSAELSWYISTGEWKGVAGAYRIQMRGACIVKTLQGSYSNVVGLPIDRIYGILVGLGFSF